MFPAGPHEIVADYGDGFTMQWHKAAPESQKATSTHEYYALHDSENQMLACLRVDVKEKILETCLTPQKMRVSSDLTTKYIIPYLARAMLIPHHFVSNTGLIHQDGNYYHEEELPEHFHYRSALNLTMCTELQALPRGLTIDGSLLLEDCALLALPDDLTVKGRIAMENNGSIRKIGKNVKTGGNLVFFDIPIEEVGENLQVEGSVIINLCAPFALPANLSVGKDLRICGDFTMLPSGLRVGGELDVAYTKITEIPADAIIAGEIKLPA